MSRFLSALRVEQVSDTDNEGRGLWRLTSPLLYFSSLTNDVYTVPEGFLTDYASVPRAPVVFWLTGDTCARPSVVHDFAYSKGKDGKHPVPDRATADALLREAALAEGAPAWRVALIYRGVRLFGGSHWA